MSPAPLNQFKSGTTVKIANLLGGSGARSKLYAMGLIPGTTVYLNQCGKGPCKMQVRNSELVLGQGLAEKILAVEDN